VDIIGKLSKILDKDSLLTKKEELIPYSRDASFFQGALPLAVAIPNNVKQLSEIMKICYEEEVPVYVRGGGSSLTGSSVPLENSIVEALGSDLNKVSVGNIKARIRMILLYAFASKKDALVVGTGDKSEITLGYFTKYGDGGVDLLPLGDLYKTQV